MPREHRRTGRVKQATTKWLCFLYMCKLNRFAICKNNEFFPAIYTCLDTQSTSPTTMTTLNEEKMVCYLASAEDLKHSACVVLRADEDHFRSYPLNHQLIQKDEFCNERYTFLWYASKVGTCANCPEGENKHCPLLCSQEQCHVCGQRGHIATICLNGR